eukprot:gene11882-13115_t
MAANVMKENSKESFLETYFYGTAQFLFDASKELVDKEKEGERPGGSIWSFFLMLLSDLINAERHYFALNYIEKRVLRRDVIRPLYDKLQTDLRKLGTTETASKVDAAVIEEGGLPLLSDLSMQMSTFVNARKEMIDLYPFPEKSPKVRASVILHAISNLEVEVVKNLFKAEQEMQKWRFFPSLMLLYECQANLNSWIQLQPPHSTRELAAQTTATKSPVVLIATATRRHRHLPFLYQWLYQLHLAVVSKFSLYFHTTLSAQTNPAEMKLMSTKTSIDYFTKLSTFIKKSDALNVSLILDTTSMERVSGHGYTLPNIQREKPSGIEMYPAIVSLPESKPTIHWPAVISILTGKTGELSCPGRVVYFFDDRQKRTYYLIKVDVNITMVIVFNVKKKEKDSYVQKFLLETRSLLNHDSNFQMLKPRQSQKFLK